MNKAALLALLILTACGESGSPAGPADSFPDSGVYDIPEAPPGPEGQWMYENPEPWGCDLNLSLNPNNTYAVALLCPSYETDGTDVFLEMGTYTDDGSHLQMAPLSSTCPGYPGEDLDLAYSTDPFVIYVPDELPLVPAVSSSFSPPVRYGCQFTDGSFQELPLTCHETGEPGTCASE